MRGDGRPAARKVQLRKAQFRSRFPGSGPEDTSCVRRRSLAAHARVCTRSSAGFIISNAFVLEFAHKMGHFRGKTEDKICCTRFRAFYPCTVMSSNPVIPGLRHGPPIPERRLNETQHHMLDKSWVRRLRVFVLRRWVAKKTRSWKTSSTSGRVWNRRLRSPTKCVVKTAYA